MKLSKTLNPTKIKHKHLLIIFLIFGLFLRLLWPISQNTFFSDQDWFYRQAADSLTQGKFPLLGITTSITWLHQGPLWTYLLIPTLAITNFHPLSGTVLTIFFSLATLLFIYSEGTAYLGKRIGLLSSFLYTFFFFSIVHSRIAYHTSPIPLFILISFHLLRKKDWFMSGLFFGFLYQLHLLTFIFWPLALYLAHRKSANPFLLLAGIIVGITPLIIAGPVQVFGILLWLLKFITGLSSSSGLSVSYQVVLLLPLLFLSASIISKLSNKLQFIFCAIFIFLNMYYLLSSRYLTRYLSYQPTLETQIGKAKNCQTSQSDYIYWWLSKNKIVDCYN